MARYLVRKNKKNLHYFICLEEDPSQTGSIINPDGKIFKMGEYPEDLFEDEEVIEEGNNIFTNAQLNTYKIYRDQLIQTVVIKNGNSVTYDFQLGKKRKLQQDDK